MEILAMEGFAWSQQCKGWWWRTGLLASESPPCYSFLSVHTHESILYTVHHTRKSCPSICSMKLSTEMMDGTLTILLMLPPQQWLLASKCSLPLQSLSSISASFSISLPSAILLYSSFSWEIEGAQCLTFAWSWCEESVVESRSLGRIPTD